MADPFTTPFDIDTLGDLDDGTVRAVTNAAIQQALDDCDARPVLDKARKVQITIALKPVPDTATGAMKGVHVDVAVKTTVPPQQGNGDYLRANVAGDHARAYMPDSQQDTMFTRDDQEAS